MALDWKDFFQFSKDDTFDVIEEDGLLQGRRTNLKLGEGKVLDITEDKLALEFDIISQTINLSGFLSPFGSVDVPRVTCMLLITLVDEGTGNRLEVTGTYVDPSGEDKSFSYTDTDLEAKLRNSGNRLRLNASDEFLDGISGDSTVRRLGRLQFEKTGSANSTQMDIGRVPVGDTIDILLELNQ